LVDEESFVGQPASKHGSKGISGKVSAILHVPPLIGFYLIAVKMVVPVRLEHSGQLFSKFVHGKEVDFNVEGVAVVIVELCYDTGTRLATVALLS
jgi:hypothetical protein